MTTGAHFQHRRNEQQITSVTQLRDEGSIPGVAGRDYPEYTKLPGSTSFNCDQHVKEEKQEGHLFPDITARCQVHIRLIDCKLFATLIKISVYISM